VLFGDGAGAMVLQASGDPGGILSCVAGNDGRGADFIRAPGVSAIPSESLTGDRYLCMDGGPVFKIAVRAIADSTLRALSQAELKPDDVDLFIPHQANIRIINSAAQAAMIPEEKVFVNVDRYGNTAAASIPIAVCEAVEGGRLHDGHKLLLSGVGAGFSWASMVVEWGMA
jgi:3-oxoacyl-[acyl-carrier-protein] synthase-3